MKKLLLLLISLSPLFAISPLPPHKKQEESIQSFIAPKMAHFKAMNTQEKLQWAGCFAMKEIMTWGSFALGLKYLPAMKIMRLGRFTIPLRTVANCAGSSAIGYTPLVAQYLTPATPIIDQTPDLSTNIFCPFC